MLVKLAADSIMSMLIKLIPNATFKADFNGNCLSRMAVSTPMLVINPIVMAIIIINHIAVCGACFWKIKTVKLSPIEHPNRHQAVFLALLRQLCLLFQLKRNKEDVVNMLYCL